MSSKDFACPGATLSDRYLIGDVIGQGSFGRVFRATDLVTKEQLALKEFVRLSGRTDSFLRELGILFELKHPHVIDCRSLVVAGTFRYLVYELMGEGSLRTAMHTNAYTSLELVMLLVEVAAGVQYAHERRVIHRDLKPENILLTRYGGKVCAKVSDFGISKHASSYLEAHSCIGSPAYMAPEQFYDQYDARVDIYALGVILYELLCGRRPFLGSPAQLMAGHLKQDPYIPLWIPKAFSKILKKALAKKPEKRFADMAAFRRALQAAIHVSGRELASEHWPLRNAGAVRRMVSVAGDVYVDRADELVRLDLGGRMVERSEPVQELIRGHGLHGRRNGTCLDVHFPSSVRRHRLIPEEAQVSISGDGAVVFCADRRAVVVAPTGTRVTLERVESVGAACFFGPDQTLVTVHNETDRARVEYGGVRVDVPEPIGEIVGLPTRHELVARSAADPERLYLIRHGSAFLVRLACTELVTDGDSFFSVTREGDLAQINVTSNRIAKTRWESPLQAVAPGEQAFVVATREGQIHCWK